MNMLKKQLLFFAGLGIGVTTMFAVELYDQIRAYQSGMFHE